MVLIPRRYHAYINYSEINKHTHTSVVLMRRFCSIEHVFGDVRSGMWKQPSTNWPVCVMKNLINVYCICCYGNYCNESLLKKITISLLVFLKDEQKENWILGLVDMRDWKRYVETRIRVLHVSCMFSFAQIFPLLNSQKMHRLAIYRTTNRVLSN